VLYLCVPAGVGIAVLARPIVRLLFERGAFDDTSTLLTSQALACYVLGAPARYASIIFNRTFFSLKDTRTPARQGIARVVVKILLAALLVQPLAHVGIALAETLSHCTRVFQLFRALPEPLRRGQGRATLAALARFLAASATMAAGVHILSGSLHGFLLALLALVLAGVGIYGVLSLLLATEELPFLWKTLIRLRPKAARS
jgi:putative peptidoglycan lipid II flippase